MWGPDTCGVVTVRVKSVAERTSVASTTRVRPWLSVKSGIAGASARAVGAAANAVSIVIATVAAAAAPAPARNPARARTPDIRGFMGRFSFGRGGCSARGGYGLVVIWNPAP